MDNEEKSLREKLSLNFYYCLIFLLSLLVMTVAPMFTPSANTDLGISAIFYAQCYRMGNLCLHEALCWCCELASFPLLCKTG